MARKITLEQLSTEQKERVVAAYQSHIGEDNKDVALQKLREELEGGKVFRLGASLLEVVL